MARSYTSDLPGGTATTTIQIQQRQTFKSANFTLVNAAAGSVELSLVPVSQIGTAQPTSDVVGRIRLSGTAGPAQEYTLPINVVLAPFESIYVHQTGAGNVGQINLA